MCKYFASLFARILHFLEKRGRKFCAKIYTVIVPLLVTITVDIVVTVMVTVFFVTH